MPWKYSINEINRWFKWLHYNTIIKLQNKKFINSEDIWKELRQKNGGIYRLYQLCSNPEYVSFETNQTVNFIRHS